MIYVYAIVEGNPEPPSGAGFGGAPLLVLEQAGIAGVYSEGPAQPPAATEETLWLHERILEDLMESGAVLPLRFASILPDEAALRELLTARHAEFARALAGLRGRVEIGVRASAPAEPGAGKPASGREYLAAKLERRRAAARLGETLHSELAAAACASTFKLSVDPQPAFSGSYLVDRARIDDFRRSFETARAARPGVALACTGPWPPFSFTEPLESS